MKLFFYTTATVLVALLTWGNAGAQIIRTIAGDGILGATSGDGGPATAAMIGIPVGVAIDARGNVFISDMNSYVIRKVTRAGVISTYAGTTGISGYSGDGGPATSATFGFPQNITVDAIGNLYIADNGNAAVRKVDTSGIITTIAGIGTWGFSGDGGPATLAKINGGLGLAVDKYGNLYIADGNTRVRKVNTAGIISTVAGSSSVGFGGDGGAATSASLNGPAAVAVDTAGNIYIADATNGAIRKVNTSGIISTVAGTGVTGYTGDGGAATSAKLNNPYGVAIDSMGNIYIADQNNNRVRKVNTAGIITTYAGTGVGSLTGDGGAPDSATVKAPTALFFNRAGNLFIADKANRVIREITDSSTITISASPAGPICSGTTVVFTANTVNGDYGPVYQWFVNGTGAGTDAPTYSSSTLSTGDVVTCRITDPFDSFLLDSSAAITMSVNPILTTGITIAATPGTTIHTGDAVTFTATPVNGGTAPTYQWLLNGVPVPGATGAAYTTDTLHNSDTVSCNMISNAPCAMPVADTSTVTVITVTEGVQQLSAMGSFALFPNPNKGDFNLTGILPISYTSDVRIRITDLAGRNLYATAATAQNGRLNTTVSVGNIPAGAYLLCITSGSQSSVLYFAVEK